MNSSRLPLAMGFLAAGIVLIGISVGAVAYFAGEGPREGAPSAQATLGYVPPSARLIGHLDLKSLASSPLADDWSTGLKKENALDAFEELREETGIDLFEDVDGVTFSGSSEKAAPGDEPWGIAITGSFDFDKLIQKLAAREKDLKKSTHAGTTLYTLTGVSPRGPSEPTEAPHTFAIAHPDPATLLVGDVGYLKEMLDTHGRGGEAAAGLLDGWGYGGLESETFWIAGNPPEFIEGVVGQGKGQPPPLKSFVITGRLDSELLLKARGKAIDSDSAQKLADVVRGFVALGRLRQGSGSSAETFTRIADSIQIDQTNEEIEVSLMLPYDTLRELMRQGRSEEAAAK